MPSRVLRQCHHGGWCTNYPRWRWVKADGEVELRCKDHAHPSAEYIVPPPLPVEEVVEYKVFIRVINMTGRVRVK